MSFFHAHKRLFFMHCINNALMDISNTLRIYFSGVEGESVHFYGNSGVCVFKYLVTQNDPQKWFTVAVLLVNFACFVIISASYIVINAKTVKSSKMLTGSQNKELANRNRKLQLKVSAIIFTDFLCWVPFTIICFLHFGGFIDATLWYPIFSSIIIPINSVINPVLYDSLLGTLLHRPFGATYKRASTFLSTVRRPNESNDPATDPQEPAEEFELKPGCEDN